MNFCTPSTSHIPPLPLKALAGGRGSGLAGSLWPHLNAWRSLSIRTNAGPSLSACLNPQGKERARGGLMSPLFFFFFSALPFFTSSLSSETKGTLYARDVGNTDVASIPSWWRAAPVVQNSLAEQHWVWHWGRTAPPSRVSVRPHLWTSLRGRTRERLHLLWSCCKYVNASLQHSPTCNF